MAIEERRASPTTVLVATLMGVCVTNHFRWFLIFGAIVEAAARQCCQEQ